MRITGGRARGIPLSAGRQAPVRPATDRMREAVFSSLGTRVTEARFVDLFAGSGAYGLEAWSRGAAGGVFVEKNRNMLGAIKANVAAVARSLEANPAAVEVVSADALKWAPDPGSRVELIFIDPPYEIIGDVGPDLLERLADWLVPGGVVVFEMPGSVTLTASGWECYRRLGKGSHQPSCCFFRRSD